MFSYLIPNDKIKNLDNTQVLDIWDYIQMRSRHLPAMVKFNAIRSMVITEGGMTLWQLTEKYLDSQGFRPIGQLEAPLELYIWILENCKKTTK
jgi:hypothetical protein